MKRCWIEYRCRRCAAVATTIRIDQGDEPLILTAKERMVRAYRLDICRPAIGFPGDRLHVCVDGGHGIMDMIGLSPIEEG